MPEASMNKPSRLTVSAAEFTRHFGHLRHSLGDAPVFVTHHGRETHVLISKSRYDDLRGGAAVNDEAWLPQFGQLAETLPQGVIVMDQDSQILTANRPAHVMLARLPGTLLGQQLLEAVPEVRGSPVESYIHRASQSCERQRADLPSPTRPGRWLQLDLYPGTRFTVVLLHDITDEVRLFRLADRDRAAAEALRMHPRVGEVVLSLRGQIESLSAVVTRWLALPEDRVRGVALSDLVPTPSRPAFREALDGVLRGQGPAQFSSELLNNQGETVPVQIALIELRGIYASEGALAILTGP